MPENALAFPALLSDAGLWIGLLLTLALFSLLLGDNALARVAQHLLVGAGLGYAALLAVQYVISMRLLAPLAQGRWLTHSAPLLLGLLLLAAGIERIAAQGRAHTPQSAARTALQTAGVLPIALLLGVGIAAGVVGVVQGTLLPQAVAAMLGAAGRTMNGAAAPSNGLPVWVGALTLLLTTATLLSLTLDRPRQVDPLPRPLRGLLLAWLWIGERALWVATGVLLARLFASRLTLLVDRLDYLALTLQATGLWQWIESIWLNLIS